MASWWRICLHCGRPGFDPWVAKIPWRRERLPTPVLWPGEFHGLYRVAKFHGLYIGCKESDTTERLSLFPSKVIADAFITALLTFCPHYCKSRLMISLHLVWSKGFGKQSFIGTQAYSFVYILSLAAFNNKAEQGRCSMAFFFHLFLLVGG